MLYNKTVKENARFTLQDSKNLFSYKFIASFILIIKSNEYETFWTSWKCYPTFSVKTL